WSNCRNPCSPLRRQSKNRVPRRRALAEARAVRNAGRAHQGFAHFYTIPLDDVAGSEEVRALQRCSAAFQTEMPITTRARPHEPAGNWGTAAKERRIRTPSRYPAPPVLNIHLSGRKTVPGTCEEINNNA